MTATSDVRPEFYEGQTLGAADLNEAVTYAKTRDARHFVGAHVWGIAAGLQLYELPHASDGGVDMFLRPGYAFDGFARPIVVLAPYSIPPSLFQNFGFDPTNPGGYLVQIWMQYNQAETQAPQPGFEVCNTGDSFSRVVETFSLVAALPGTVPPGAYLPPNTTPISVAGQSIAANQAYSFTNNSDPATADPPLNDASVPFQTFPDDGAQSPWLIPLGEVLWAPNTVPSLPGMFMPRSTDQLAASEAIRMYIGVIAANVLAPAGQITLADRLQDYTSPKLISNDFLNINGSTLAGGDIRLKGTQLDFRAASGGPSVVPLTFIRTDKSPLTTLDLSLGTTTSGPGPIRFGIGPLDTTQTPPAVVEKFVVLANGNVGIGTTTPIYPLQVRDAGIGIGNDPVAGNNFYIAADSNDGSGGTSGPRALRLYNGKLGASTPLMTVLTAGQVCIGAATAPSPGLQLDIRGDFGCLQSSTLHLFGSTIGDVGSGILFLRSAGGIVKIDALSGTNRVGIGLGANLDLPLAELDVRGDILIRDGTQHVASAGEPLRFIRGTVTAAGVPSAGTGFTVAILSTGIYVINFSPPYSDIPSGSVTQIYDVPGGGSTLDNAVIVQIGKSSMTVKTGKSDGNPDDRDFTFIVAGPR